MTDIKNISFLIVEDEALIAEDLYLILTNNGYKSVSIAHTYTDALDTLKNRNPNFAILDINLGSEGSGLDIAEVIHSQYKIPYLFLTSFDDDNTLEAAQKFGPYGYLVKPFQERTLLSTIKIALSNHDKYSKQKKLRKEDVEQKFGKKITQQEFKIIAEILSGKSYKQISGDLYISMNTVKFHLKNIYTKLDIKGRAELAYILL